MQIDDGKAARSGESGLPTHLHIAAVGAFPHDQLLGPAVRYLSGVFGSPARIGRLQVDHGKAFDPARNQYNSSIILLDVLLASPPDALRILAVTDLDICVPVLTFLFGEAQYKGKAAIVSTHRLREEFYGLPPDPQRLQERFLKEAVHELGHTYGLGHCASARCVMNASTRVEQIDDKSLLFCGKCLLQLRAGP